MKLIDVKNALLSVTKNVRHYTYPNAPQSYIVYAEDMQKNAEYGDGEMKRQTLEGTIDFYTKKEHDSTIVKIQEALIEHGIPFQLSSVQYEPETKYLHYEWVFECDAESELM